MKTNLERVHQMTFASVYPLYITKAENKGRTKEEVDQIISWLTGYSQQQLERARQSQTSFKDFFDQAPSPNPNRQHITGIICGVRVEEIQDLTLREVRYLDKLIDELSKGRPMQKILRQPQP